jgi:hypothetical protein
MMKYASLIGATVVSIAVLVVGFALYRQNERQFVESQRWFEVCKRQQQDQALAAAELARDDPSLPEEVRKNAQLGIQGWSEDYLYSKCFKEWHGGD